MLCCVRVKTIKVRWGCSSREKGFAVVRRWRMAGPEGDQDCEGFPTPCIHPHPSSRRELAEFIACLVSRFDVCAGDKLIKFLWLICTAVSSFSKSKEGRKKITSAVKYKDVCWDRQTFTSPSASDRTLFKSHPASKWENSCQPDVGSNEVQILYTLLK